jgi:uncharacterized protein (DUF4415 family)
MSANKHATTDFLPDPDDAPELDDAWFESADQHENGVLVRRGRPKLAAPKKHVTFRLDAELIEKLRESGPGWQSRVNEILRKAMGL